MPRILIVEDEPIIAGGLQDDLTLEGYDVTVVGDGTAALKRADPKAQVETSGYSSYPVYSSGSARSKRSHGSTRR